jgi:hypothetical protein
MTQTISFPQKLSVSDEVQRMLLRCILHDASELHYGARNACPACRARGKSAFIPAAARVCCGDEHEQQHNVPITQYGNLDYGLESYEDVQEGIAYPLAAADLDTLAAALAEAITYRASRDAPEDRALLAAYRELATAS